MFCQLRSTVMSKSLDLARSFLLKLEPERAHELTLVSLEQGFHPRSMGPHDPRLAQRLWGMAFPNPIGVAAGFDKDGRAAKALLAMGFGFAEVGTVTPRPQAGNPRPRVFRLVEDGAVINRLGFNSEGHEAVLARLQKRSQLGVIGVNIGANADSKDKAADYVAGLKVFAGLADYFVVNISSPNTPGLRELQAPDALDTLLARIVHARHEVMATGAPRRPVLVKLAPDIADEELEDIVAMLMRHGVDGIIVSNTTIARTALKDQTHAKEAGGLSGAPLFVPSTRMLANVYLLTEGQVPLVGVGGVASGGEALDKMRAGASLVQLYTGLIYHGTELIDDMKQALVEELDRAGAESIAGLIGSEAAQWAARSPG